MKLAKKKALYQAATNFFIWACVPIIFRIFELINGKDLKTTFPKDALLKLVEPTQLFVFLVAGVLYFLFFALVRHKSKNEKEQDRAKFFADLGFDEMASALYGFGSILLVSTLIGAPWWYLFLSAICYIVGYFLKPDDETASTSLQGAVSGGH